MPARYDLCGMDRLERHCPLVAQQGRKNRNPAHSEKLPHYSWELCRVEILEPNSGNVVEPSGDLTLVKRLFVGCVGSSEHALGVTHLTVVHPAVADRLFDGDVASRLAQVGLNQSIEFGVIGLA